jgi:FMN phosphatase YigB (HAD superfamily)
MEARNLSLIYHFPIIAKNSFMEILKGIKNIIFDFGGVVIDIDYHRTKDSFKDLGAENFDELYSQFQQKQLFSLFETGEINEDDFFSGLKSMLPVSIETEKLIHAWNAMLLDFPGENYEFLKSIKSRYRTFLLSNTNETHLEYYFNRIKEWYGIENMDSLFEKTYYSCRLGLRKPNPEIFEFVLKDAGLLPEETLFIDDSPQHVEGAR